MDSDGTTLRSYIPKDGNTWNYDTESAFGNDEEADSTFLIRWAKDNNLSLSPRVIEQNPTDNAEIMFDENKIIKDIENNIQIDS